ncbi:hypothetical protein RCL1_005269 [Eukaryota sp. TZLM3-RCL]
MPLKSKSSNNLSDSNIVKLPQIPQINITNNAHTARRFYSPASPRSPGFRSSKANNRPSFPSTLVESPRPRPSYSPEKIRECRVSFLKQEREKLIRSASANRRQDRLELMKQKEQLHNQAVERMEDILKRREEESKLRGLLYQERLRSRQQEVLQVKMGRTRQGTSSDPVVPPLALSTTPMFASLTPRKAPVSCGGFYMSAR